MTFYFNSLNIVIGYIYWLVKKWFICSWCCLFKFL